MTVANAEKKAQVLQGVRPQPEQVSTERHGFGEIERTAGRELASTSLAAMAKATVEARYIVAQSRKRDPDAVRQRLLARCDHPRFAEVALYNLPARGQGEPITGPSIRFVEAALREMGNVHAEATPIFDDAEKRVICYTVSDLEANTTFSRTLSISKTVERKRVKDTQSVVGRRTNSYGDMIYIVEATDDELATKIAALESKVLRGLGLRIIDGGLVDECTEKIDLTLELKSKADPDGERKKIIDGFFALGVRVDDLKAYVGTDVTTLDPATMKHLRQVWTALKEGHTTWAEVVEARAAVLGKAAGPEAGKAATDTKSRADQLADRLKKGSTGSQPQGTAANATKGNVATPVAGSTPAASTDSAPKTAGNPDAEDPEAF